MTTRYLVEMRIAGENWVGVRACRARQEAEETVEILRSRLTDGEFRVRDIQVAAA